MEKLQGQILLTKLANRWINLTDDTPDFIAQFNSRTGLL